MPATVTDSTLTGHQALEALLPWYANGTLTPVETATVEHHLAECGACRAELEQCRALAQTLQPDASEVWRPSPGGFDRLLAQIDRLEAPLAPAQSHHSDASDARPAPAYTRRPTLLERLRDWLGSTPHPVRWTLALESLAVVALLLIALPPGKVVTAPDYETLSNDDQLLSPATGPRLRVIFDETATVGDLQRLLREIGGGIVAGPTALGVYTVALAGGSRAEQNQADALNRLRGHPQVRLAEPQTQGIKP